MRRLFRHPRRRHVTVVILLIAALATAIAKGLKRSGWRGAAPTRGTARRVVDGDTFDLTNGARIRLLDIDTPEFDSSDTEREFAQKATDALKGFLDEGLSGAVVRLEYGPRVRDRYDRFLAYVFVEQAEDSQRMPQFVNLELVRRGLARAYAAGDPGARYEDILAAEREAHTAQRGIWSAP